LIKLNRRGSVLVHVLITGVVVAFIAAGMLRMVMMNYIAVDRVAKGATNRKEAEAMLNRAITYWSISGQVCSAIPNGFACTGVPGTCACDCPSAGAVPRIHAVMAGAPAVCTVDLVSSDPQ
jgi:coenzyme F420-reducing hydrogenase gamma subunit